MLPKLNTRVLLFVVLACNVIALGAGEVQRRVLVRDFPDLQSRDQVRMTQLLEQQHDQLLQQLTLLGQLQARSDVINKKIVRGIQETDARFDSLSVDVKEIKQSLLQAKQSPQ